MGGSQSTSLPSSNFGFWRWLTPVVIDVAYGMLRLRQQPKRLTSAEHDQRRKNEDEKERKRHSADQERKRQAAEQERNRLARENEARWEAAERVRREEVEQAREREAKHELDKQYLQEQINVLMQDIRNAQMERDRDTEKALKQLTEKIELEKLERQQANRMQDMKYKDLVRTLVDAFKLFVNYYRANRKSPPLETGMHQSSSQDQSLGYEQERLILIANFGLSKENDKDIDNIFAKSFLLLEDQFANNQDTFFDTAESSKHPNITISNLPDQLPAGFEDDLLNVVMTTINDTQDPQVANLLALHNQVYRSSGDDTVSSAAMTAMNNGNVEGALEDGQAALKLESNNPKMEQCAQFLSSKAATKAKEEGNDYFIDQKFEEAIESYSVSITNSPTAVAYSNRAMAYIKLNKMMEAENDCTKALEIDSQSFKAYARRAIAREKLGDNIKGALSDVEVALKLEPNNQEMKELHAKLIQMLG